MAQLQFLRACRRTNITTSTVSFKALTASSCERAFELLTLVQLALDLRERNTDNSNFEIKRRAVCNRSFYLSSQFNFTKNFQKTRSYILFYLESLC